MTITSVPQSEAVKNGIKQNRTANLGEKTHIRKTTHSVLDVANLDPEFDYSFRRIKDVEDGDGIDQYGFEPLSAANWKGERSIGPSITMAKTKGAKQIRVQDTILCKRPLEAAKYFKDMEDEKFNAQQNLVRMAAQNAKAALRELDPGATLQDDSKGMDKAFTQRVGPTTDQ